MKRCNRRKLIITMATAALMVGTAFSGLQANIPKPGTDNPSPIPPEFLHPLAPSFPDFYGTVKCKNPDANGVKHCVHVMGDGRLRYWFVRGLNNQGLPLRYNSYPNRNTHPVPYK